ncbi:MAG: histidine kinase dimerization/phosphoacceptor domain -containing protein [Flavobacterium sp.]|uniref:histidine kinase dimerization/phosphoacceptor domain -containing protein n=1 Tax=Flavobacterium sp. TaxID=239 RepID=UPI0032648677
MERQLKIAKLENEKIKILGQLGYEYYTIDPLKTIEYSNKAIKLSKKKALNESILFAYYIRGIGYYMIGKNEEAKSNAYVLIAFAKKSKSDIFTGKGIMFLGDLYYEMSKEKEAIGYYKQASYYFKKSNSKEDMAIVYSRVATTYMRFSNYEEGIKNNLKSIKLFKEIKNTRGETTVIRSLGDLYMEMKEYSSAKKMYIQALNISKSIDSTSNSPWIADNLQELGDFYTAVDSLDTAYNYYIKSLSIFKNISKSRGLPPLYNSMGVMFIKKKQYDKSLYYFNKSLKISRQNNDEFDISENLKNLGQVHLLQKKMTQSKVYLDEALTLALKIDSKQLQLDIYKIISDYYKAISEYKLSIIYLEKYYLLKETLFNETKSKQITGIQIQYDTEQKEKEIKFLNQKNEIQLLTIAKQKYATELFTIIFIMLLIIVSILFWLFRLKRNANRSLQNKNKEIDNKNVFLENAQQKLKLSLQEKEVLLKEIHHRVKNNLQLVNSLLSIQARDSESRMDVKEFLTKSQDRVQSMALIHETLYMSDNLATVNFQEYLEKLVNHLYSAFDIDKTAIEVHMETNNIFLDIEKVIPLGLILTELINNALKHAFILHKGRIDITLDHDSKNQLRLSVCDDGTGLPENYKNKASTLGFELVDALTHQLEGKLTVDHTKGTSFTITFPY